MADKVQYFHFVFIVALGFLRHRTSITHSQGWEDCNPQSTHSNEITWTALPLNQLFSFTENSTKTHAHRAHTSVRSPWRSPFSHSEVLDSTRCWKHFILVLYWHDSVMQLLHICWLHVHDANLIFQHILNVLSGWDLVSGGNAKIL